MFTCTTSIDETTTNTVVVEGTPTDPGGEPLCDTTQAGVALQAALSTCDATDQDQARVTVVKPGTIIVTKHTEPASSESVDFSLDDQQFTLKDGGSTTFEDLAPGTYRLTEHVPSGWDLAGLTCEDATDDTEVVPAEGTAVIDLAEGETVSCEYTNVADPGTPGPDSLSDTGAPPWTGLLLALGLILLSAGVGIIASSRRRSTR